MRPLESKQYSENSFTNNKYLTLQVRLNFERNDSGRKPRRYQKHRHHSQFPSLSVENRRRENAYGLRTRVGYSGAIWIMSTCAGTLPIETNFTNLLNILIEISVCIR